MVIYLITLILSFSFLFKFLEFFKLADSEYIEIFKNSRQKNIFIIFTSIIIAILYFRLGKTSDFIVYGFLIICLMFYSLIDLKTLHIYRGMAYLLILLGFIYMIFSMIFNYYVFSLEFILLNLFIFVAILLLSANIAFGKGDSFIFIGIAEFLTVLSIKNGFAPLEILFVCYTLAIVFFLLLNIKKFDFKKIKMKEKLAYLPAITMATYLCIICFTK